MHTCRLPDLHPSAPLTLVFSICGVQAIGQRQFGIEQLWTSSDDLEVFCKHKDAGRTLHGPHVHGHASRESAGAYIYQGIYKD